MWISRGHYDQLIRRLEQCERDIRASKIYIDKWPNENGTWSNRYHELPLPDALNQLAAHMGVEFTYQPGTPDTATLVKLKK